MTLFKDFNRFSIKSLATVTDLFSLANQCPRQAIQPHTDQSAGRAH